ncbi:conserved Plasmodium protein, unknown function [Plasmodium berghei]|uniref:Uncharacterized protein n=1 Tax=Plasmodium berghei TaxID=5821 RepID=A0A1D3Q2Z0_PLABE|nr:conserved Plasmodium protein, unknown function [Plasmodium berghei]
MFLPNIKLSNKSNLMKTRRNRFINYKNTEKRKGKFIDEANKVNELSMFKNCKKIENEQTYNNVENICREVKENSIMSIPEKMKKNDISNELKKETKNEYAKGNRNNVTRMRNDESHTDYKTEETMDTHIYDKEKKENGSVGNVVETGKQSLNNLAEEDKKNNEIIKKEENTEISTSNDLELKIDKEIELGIKKKKKKSMSEEIRKKLSELAKLRWRNEEERKKLLRCKNKFKHSEKTKQLLSYKIKLKWKDENYRKSVIQKTLIFNQDENTKRRKSLILKEKWKLKEFREKMLCNRKPFSIERRKKISDIIKQKWREEGYKKKTLNAIRENYKKRKLNVGLNPNLNYIQNLIMFKQLGISAPKIRQFPEHSEKTKQLLSYKIKLKWKDENYRKSVIQKTLIFNQDENTKRRKSLILKEKWKLKEFREKMLCNRKPFSIERRKKISDIIKQKWREEGYKKKTLNAIRENYKKRKLNVGLNPNLNYIQNLIMFKQLGISAPKIRQFPEVHKEKLRGEKKKKKKKKKKINKENWKNIYDSILDKNEFRNPIPYLGSIDHLSVSTNT